MDLLDLQHCDVDRFLDNSSNGVLRTHSHTTDALLSCAQPHPARIPLVPKSEFYDSLPQTPCSRDTGVPGVSRGDPNHYFVATA